jgi:hypothetical protein
MTMSAARKVAARKARNAHSKKTRKNTAKTRDRSHKTVSKVAAQLRNNIAAETVRETYRKIDASFDQFRGSQVFNQFRGSQMQGTLRVLAERNVAQTRELYERSKNTLQAVLESWQKSFSAAGQVALSFNRKITDVAERNMETGFDLAIGLAGARNLAEIMELQAAYWHKIAGGQTTQPKTRAPRRNPTQH